MSVLWSGSYRRRRWKWSPLRRALDRFARPVGPVPHVGSRPRYFNKGDE